MNEEEIEEQEFLKELLGEFQEEARQRLTKIENLLISFSPEKEEVGKEIKRELHTLKGSAAMLSLDTFSKLSHKLEDLFKQIEEKKVFHSNLLSFFLDAISLMKEYLSDASIEKKLTNFIEEIENYNFKKGKKELKKSRISQSANIESRNESRYLSIEVEKMNEFLSFIGELILKEEELIRHEISIKQINKMSKKLLKEEKYEKLREDIKETYYFFKEYINLNKIYMEELKNYIHILRTQPLSVIFDSLPAQVFKMAKGLGKDVDFIVKGREIQLDRRIISQISEPLIHMIRNAIDHGIESGVERKKKGKRERGEIILSAKYEGDNIYIELRDDGKGIDVEKIKEKALSKKIISEEELKSLSEQGIMNLIFTPGFSTKSNVTMVSGRGVGMDIVKNRVLELGGEIFIDSKKDQYTKIILRLPTTLGISRILFLKIENFTFGTFSFHVKNILEKNKHEIVTLGGERFLKIKKLLIPVIDTSRIFSKKNLENYYIQFYINRQCFILPVDKILDEREIIVRPISTYLRKKIKFFNSFVVLGEGKVVPLIDSGVIFNYRNIYKNRNIGKEVKKEERTFPKILLAEDAPVTRKMEAIILRDEGFLVYEAENGKKALDIFEKVPDISLIITDLEMPIMDGARLIKNIREKNKDIPIVVVTTLKEKEIKKEVLNSINLIVFKKDFTKRDFLNKIKKIIKEK